jgi:hypothetical protein
MLRPYILDIRFRGHPVSRPPRRIVPDVVSDAIQIAAIADDLIEIVPLPDTAHSSATQVIDPRRNRCLERSDYRAKRAWADLPHSLTAQTAIRNEQDAMHMVGHYHEGVDPDVREVIRNARPVITGNGAERTQAHFASVYTAKKVRRRADGNQVHTWTCVVMAPQPD